ncbi:MAG: hypothetical protein GX234_05985 [Clostridiales bacterium]|nr:hypothetical protein [Clostridiales bacterium]
MKFIRITETEFGNEELGRDYEAAKKVGRYAIGKLAVYCPKMFKYVYIAMNDIIWAYRRQEAVEGKLCCGKANFEIHKVILYTAKKQRFELAGMGMEQAKQILAILERENPSIDIGYSKEKETQYIGKTQA